jgi:peptidoglycan/LPS O-acetylase OafA/YrhL
MQMIKGTGPLGVDLFFALSGFLIGRILLRIGGGIELPRVVVGFWGRRWLRTLPLYYVVLIAHLLIVLYHEDHVREVLVIVSPYVYFGQCFFSRPVFFFVESWSLAVEECFYLVFPLIVAGVTKFGVKSLHSYVVCGLFMLLAPVLIRLSLDPTVTRTWLYDVYMITAYRLDSIAWGVLAAAVSLHRSALWERWRYPGLLLGLTLLFFDRWTLTHGHGTTVGYMLDWHFLIAGLGCVLVLPWCSLKKTLPYPWMERAIDALAAYSYGLYLVHMMVIRGVRSFFEARISQSGPWAWFVASLVLALSFLLAVALHRWLERPCLALRERWCLTRREFQNVGGAKAIPMAPVAEQSV